MANTGTTEAVIVGAVRTPIGKQGGALSAVRPDDLAALALDALMERTGVPPSEIEDVYMGCANVAGTTINRLCGSGLDAVASAARAIMVGEAHAYVGAGVESMSRAPWTVPKPERAFATGNATMYDTTLGWRMVNPKL